MSDKSKENKTVNPAGSPKIKQTGSVESPDQYARFERLAKGLVAVPKSEIDAERQNTK